MQFFYQQKVFAGVALQLPYGGLYFVLASAGVARKVGIQLTNNGQDSKVMPDMTPGFSLLTQFDAVTFYSDIDTVVSFFASPTPVTLGVQDGGIVQVPGGVVVNNTAGQRVPVDMGGATINVTATNVGINNTDATAVPVVQKVGSSFTVEEKKLSNIVDIAPVAVGVAAVQISADATLKRLRIRNSHETAVVALGGAGVTLANAAIQLQPGDIWSEDDSAGAAWYAISDTAAVNVQLQGLK